MLILTAAGWVNRHQEDVIDYLREENRVVRGIAVAKPGEVEAGQCGFW